MSKRTTQTTVHFSDPFLLHGFDAQQPAGDYRIEREEEVIEGLSWLAWHCVATFIHLPAISADGMTRQMVQIDPADLAGIIETTSARP